MKKSMEQKKLFTRDFFLAFGANFSLFFAFYLLLPILPMYLIETFNSSDAVVGFILSSYTLTALFVRPFAGFLVDYFARKPLLIIAFALFSIFFGLYLVATTLFLFALVRACHGLSFGLLTISNSTVAIDVMPAQRRNEGIGYYGISTNIAMAVGPMSSLFVYERWGNFEYIFLFSLFIVVIGWLLTFFIRLPKREKPVMIDVEESVAEKVASMDRFFLMSGFPGAIAMSMVSFSYGIMTTYVALYGAKEMGVESNTGFFFIILAIGLITSRLFSSKMMAQGYIPKVIKIGMAILIMGYLPFIFIHNAIAFFSCAILLGLGYGFVSPGAQAMFVNLAKSNQRGTANSTFFISWDLGIGVGVMIGGQIAQISSYAMAFGFGLLLIGFAYLLFHFVAAPYYYKKRITT